MGKLIFLRKKQKGMIPNSVSILSKDHTCALKEIDTFIGRDFQWYFYIYYRLHFA